MRSIHDLVSGNVVAFKPVKFCFKQNVGALVAALKPCYNKGFLNATKNDYVTVAGSRFLTGSPFSRITECFLIVSAGNGRVAFYSPWYQKFVQADNYGNLKTVNSNKVCSMHDRPRMDESFTVKRANHLVVEKDLSVKIFTAVDRSYEVRYKYSSDNSTSPFHVYKVHGFV